jgi:hypothetical protein
MSYKARCILRLLAVSFSVFIIAFILYSYAKNNYIRNILPPCFIYTHTGIYCPGCGSGRSLLDLLHGHIPDAIRCNALFVCTLPLLSYIFCRYAIDFIRGKRPSAAGSLSLRFVNFYTAAVIIFLILRNIPFPPFNYLAPVAV